METTQEAIKQHQEMCNVMRVNLELKGIVGPWMTEPDRVEFEYQGMRCLMVRNPQLFNWCGYVGVEKQFPIYGKEYEELGDIDVHGGLTFSSPCSGPICHITDNPDNLYWFGFDCAHWNDAVPGIDFALMTIERPLLSNHDKKSYRELDYVKAETMKLAEQLKEKIKKPRRRKHVSG